MDKKDFLILFVIFIILLVPILYLICSLFFPDLLPLLPFYQKFEHFIKKDPYLPAKTFFTLINIGLLIPLIVIYTKLYRNIPNRFTLGLILIIVSLLFNVITASPFMIHLLGLVSFRDGPFQFIPTIFTTIALILLVRLSIE
ncbi:hypothetical protein DK846_03720 [Methanospirillum lacunae]|uniref:Uncharacterized protein n=1 Tax=Methanospirillum lacunae TaxID=668570 RepID=A0A2V2N6Y8_9EURY|nr:hypothetical protein DK846_03720 [Methanospirillum lacunae]